MTPNPKLPVNQGTAILPNLPPELAYIQGNIWHVKPKNGLDTNSGKSPAQAFKTLAKALSVCTANQNDIVLMYAESNTAADTTDYQTATLDWNKDLVHLIGVNSGSLFSSRSRVAFKSDYATASNLFTLSANGCQVRGIEFWAGVANANPTGSFKATGQRNKIVGCHIAGMGTTQMDIANAFSLSLTGAQENLFEDCTIGQDTVTLGAASNSVLLFSSGAVRNIFRRCRFMLYTNHATNCVFLRAAAGSMDRYQIFDDCQFINAIDSGSTNLTQAFVVAAGGSPAGGILLVGGKTLIQGATDWNSADAGNVTAGSGSVTAGTFGLATDVTR